MSDDDSSQPLPAAGRHPNVPPAAQEEAPTAGTNTKDQNSQLGLAPPCEEESAGRPPRSEVEAMVPNVPPVLGPTEVNSDPPIEGTQALPPVDDASPSQGLEDVEDESAPAAKLTSPARDENIIDKTDKSKEHKLMLTPPFEEGSTGPPPRSEAGEPNAFDDMGTSASRVESYTTKTNSSKGHQLMLAPPLAEGTLSPSPAPEEVEDGKDPAARDENPIVKTKQNKVHQLGLAPACAERKGPPPRSEVEAMERVVPPEVNRDSLPSLRRPRLTNSSVTPEMEVWHSTRAPGAYRAGPEVDNNIVEYDFNMSTADVEHATGSVLAVANAVLHEDSTPSKSRCWKKAVLILLIVVASGGIGIAIAVSINKRQKNETPATLTDQPTPSPTQAPTLPGEWVELGQTLQGNAPFDHLGGFGEVSLSADGMVLAVGAIGTDHTKNGTLADIGYVYVYRLQGGTEWVQVGRLGNLLQGPAADESFGISVSLSGDGSVLAVGSFLKEDSGSVSVYRLDNDDWVPNGQTIISGAPQDKFGSSVSLSADGAILAIGASQADGVAGVDSGCVRVYSYNGVLWAPIGSKIEGTGSIDKFGSSVTLSSDGSTLAVGAPRHDGSDGNNVGQVRVFRRGSDSWEPVGAEIVGRQSPEGCGEAVSLSSNGSILAIGCYQNSDNGKEAGAVRIYGLQGDNLIQIGRDIHGEAARDQAGRSVALSEDGTTVTFGGYRNDGNGIDAGHVRLFRLVAGDEWRQVGPDIIGEAGGDRAGRMIALSSDGTILAVGAGNNDNVNGVDAGHVRVYQLLG